MFHNKGSLRNPGSNHPLPRSRRRLLPELPIPGVGTRLGQRSQSLAYLLRPSDASPMETC